jgi:hypothetical protein
MANTEILKISISAIIPPSISNYVAISKIVPSTFWRL